MSTDGEAVHAKSKWQVTDWSGNAVELDLMGRGAFTHSILRPAWFMQNFSETFLKPVDGPAAGERHRRGRPRTAVNRAGRGGVAHVDLRDPGGCLQETRRHAANLGPRDGATATTPVAQALGQLRPVTQSRPELRWQRSGSVGSVESVADLATFAEALRAPPAARRGILTGNALRVIERRFV
jgi:hypothetical protein